MFVLQDGGGHISKEEVEELVTMIYGSKTVEKEAAKIMKLMDEDGSGQQSAHFWQL